MARTLRSGTGQGSPSRSTSHPSPGRFYTMPFSAWSSAWPQTHKIGPTVKYCSRERPWCEPCGEWAELRSFW